MCYHFSKKIGYIHRKDLKKKKKGRNDWKWPDDHIAVLLKEKKISSPQKWIR